MIGLGTVLNVIAIIAGGICGISAGRLISGSMQDTLLKGTGVCVIFIGAAGTFQKMLSVGADGALQTNGTMVLIISIAVGTVLGEVCRIESRIEQFGCWLREKTGNAKDRQFLDGFINTSLTVCIGAMAVIGSIQDGIAGDYSILAAKALIDFIIVTVMAAGMGKGCIFAAIPVGIWQGSITLLAFAAGAFVTEDSLSYLSMVGSVLIFCVGLNLISNLKIKVANMLPALIIAVLFAELGISF